QFEHDPSDQFSLAHSDIRVLQQDQYGSLWLGSYGGGLLRYQGGTGISMLRHSLKFADSLSNPNISSVLERQNGDIWLGTRGSGVDLFQPGNGIIQRYPPRAIEGQLQQGWISAMAEMADGTLWLGVPPGQLYTFDDRLQQFQLIDETAGFYGSNVRRLMVDSQQNLWLASNQGVKVMFHQQQQFTSYPLMAERPINDFINTIVEDQQQQIWIGGGANGVFRGTAHSDGAERVRFANRSDDEPLSILGMLVDQQGELWLDTPSGLFVIDDVTAEKPELRQPDSIKALGTQAFGANLLQDQRGRIWTQTHMYDPAVPLVYRLSSTDGANLGTPWFRAYTQTRNGTMLFGGSQGLLIIKPQQFEPWLAFPPVALTSLQVDGTPQVKTPYNRIRLAANQRRFTVEFAALDLAASQLLDYSYQLVGFDQQWHYLDRGQRQVSYTNLWPGNYTLKVRSTNRNGDWGPVQLELPVYIEPKLWQQSWFVLSIILLILLLIYALIQYRTRVSRQQAQLFEQQVNERTQELKQAQKLLIEKEKMASLGQVVAGVAHEINTPVGVSVTSNSVLLNELQNIEHHFTQKTLTSQLMQQFITSCDNNLNLIAHNLQRAADLVDNFKQMAVNQANNKLQVIELPEWIQQRIEPFKYSFPHSDIAINCPRMKLNVRASALEQILHQLVHNALHHGYQAEAKARVKLDVSISDGHCLISVTDHGSGISDTLQPRIFEPFVTSKRGSRNHGLGLHLCYNLATQVLNGDIQLLSSSATGSCFQLTFPLTDD
ncbi:MAG: ATP-binding protein, partial [Alkalimonas sp.]|nr:ATP-binding protein [Alkalimonas sp.]